MKLKNVYIFLHKIGAHKYSNLSCALFWQKSMALDGWMDGWMNSWVGGGWMDGLMVGWMPIEPG